MTKPLKILLLALTLAASGCVYKLSINQGNRISEEDIAEVELGMSRSQVRFLLGTPLVADPFHADRWDYVFYFRDGKTGRELQRRFEIYFEGDTVARIEKPE